MTAVKTVTRAVAVPVFLVLAVVGQLAVVNRAPLPGGVAPDLVLLVVTAAAVTTGPMPGTLAGFAGGLALDVAPPGERLAGEYALIFCLVGYLCGRIMVAVGEATGERPAVTALTVMAFGAAAGEAGKAALGRMLSDPSVTMPAIRHVLPGAVVYDLLLCPFVLWLVSVAVRRPAPEAAPRLEFSRAQRLAGAFRPASTGAAPRLRLAGSTPRLVPSPVRAEPKLRLSGASSPALARTQVASSPARTALPGGRALKLNFAGAGRGSSLGGASAFRPPPPRPGRSPGKGWLRADRTQLAAVTAIRRTSPPKGWLRAARLVAASAPHRKSPGKGWLRPAKPAPAPHRKSPGKGWLRPAKSAPAPRRKSPGKGWLRPAKPAKSNWYTRGPSGRWLRRDRSPWRRHRRPQQFVGGRR
jgi:rod shape-determining protein MreD